MPYEFYKVLHLVAIFTLFSVFGAQLLHVMNGGQKDFAFRRWLAISHGLATGIILVAGFGLMARLGYMQSTWPTWIYFKILIWVLFGAAPALIYRMKSAAKLIWLMILFIGACAAFLAIYKPIS